jgi:polyadenylate-binding protein
MNNCTISGKQIVLNKQKDRDFDSNANLLVRNLPKSVDQRQLAEMFQKFGRIVSCKLEIYGDGSSRGFGYVQFDSVDNATKAINDLDNTEVDGMTISVLTHQKQEKREGTATERYTNLFLQNLPEDYTVENLRDIFAQYGDIASLEMGAKSGHGYVSFKEHADAKKALEAVNMKLKLGDTTVLVSPHIYKKESDLQPKSGTVNPIVQNQKEMFKSNIYVRFIPVGVTKEELEIEFNKAGPICSTKLKPYEITNKMDGTKFVSHQVAYVLYDEVKNAQKCIRMFDNSRPFGLNHKALKVDFWQAKEDLKKEKDEKSQNQIKQLINFIK